MFVFILLCCVVVLLHFDGEEGMCAYLQECREQKGELKGKVRK
jgi:hypothetical protein